ncbi:MAG: hypothetical protein R3176_04315 [Woeseiaceae bacterium]|nr:hypothetical protein [Woeseiaceae bacterium]
MAKGVLLALGLCATLGALSAAPAVAGDEVDYGAPYLVVEDGKLVTRYPGKEHEPGTAAGAGAEAGDGAEPAAGTGAGDSGRGAWFAGAAGIAVLAGVFLAWRRIRS